MSNLSHCTKETRESVKQILENPAVHTFTKTTIEVGLTKDPVDAVRDVALALQVLKVVLDDRPIIGD